VSGALRLPICQAFPLSEIVQALDMMNANRHFGKIAIVMHR
jgi:NADPH:quinone reductase-like Zn-dependent oxidoreductase